MKPKLSDLWRWAGPLDRGPYLIWGVLLAAIKFNLWPSDYWRVWSDHIIHTIHLRVLNHVKQLSERSGP